MAFINNEARLMRAFCWNRENQLFNIYFKRLFDVL